MFKPENIFFVQGHGSMSLQDEKELTPFGEAILSYNRFDLPPNVFTVSSREVGLATPPADDVPRQLRVDGKSIVVPSGTYTEYTSGIRALGKQLFSILVEKPPKARKYWEELEGEYFQRTGKSIPRLLHTHGSQHPGYTSLSVNNKKRDYFLFSAPNERLELNSFLTSGRAQVLTYPNNPFFSFQRYFFLSGVMPLLELSQKDRNIFTTDIFLPSSFFSLPMNEWKTETSRLPFERKKEWKDAIRAVVPVIKARVPGKNNSGKNVLLFNASTSLELFFGENAYAFRVLLDRTPEEFCDLFVEKMIDNLRKLYFWTPRYGTLNNFLSNTIPNLYYTQHSQEIVDSIVSFRGTSEPLLFIFYHCRSLGSNNDKYMSALNKAEKQRGRPVLSRRLSTAAALGTLENVPTQGNINYNIALTDLEKIHSNLSGSEGKRKLRQKKLTSGQITQEQFNAEEAKFAALEAERTRRLTKKNIAFRGLPLNRRVAITRKNVIKNLGHSLGPRFGKRPVSHSLKNVVSKAKSL